MSIEILFDAETTNTTSAEFNSKITDQILSIDGTWGGATATLQLRTSKDNWVPVTNSAYTEDTAVEMNGYGNSGTRKYRLEITGGTGASINAEIS